MPVCEGRPVSDVAAPQQRRQAEKEEEERDEVERVKVKVKQKTGSERLVPEVGSAKTALQRTR